VQAEQASLPSPSPPGSTTAAYNFLHKEHEKDVSDTDIIRGPLEGASRAGLPYLST